MADQPGGLAYELADRIAGRKRGAGGVQGIQWGRRLRQVERQEGIGVILGEVSVHVGYMSIWRKRN